MGGEPFLALPYRTSRVAEAPAVFGGCPSRGRRAHDGVRFWPATSLRAEQRGGEASVQPVGGAVERPVAVVGQC
ncbi:hypothetical protein ACWCQW_55650, partial [Streptomyces mirabilis]